MLPTAEAGRPDALENAAAPPQAEASPSKPPPASRQPQGEAYNSSPAFLGSPLISHELRGGVPQFLVAIEFRLSGWGFVCHLFTALSLTFSSLGVDGKCGVTCSTSTEMPFPSVLAWGQRTLLVGSLVH